MKLLQFLQNLFSNGQVTLPHKFHVPSEEEKAGIIGFLRAFQQNDRQEMPLEAPEFEPEAALWAAEYIFKAMQFLAMRNLEVELIPVHLPQFGMGINPSVAYSADLCLRYLPQIYHWSKAISQDDPLLLHFQETAKIWPFSCVGIPRSEEGRIPEHPSLRLAYAARILAAQDLQLAIRQDQKPLIQAALGPMAAKVWPAFEAFKEKNP
jgi:hypothetical protein